MMPAPNLVVNCDCGWNLNWLYWMYSLIQVSNLSMETDNGSKDKPCLHRRRKYCFHCNNYLSDEDCDCCV